MILLDSNAVSDLMKDNAAIKARVAASTVPISTSVVVQGEIWYGIELLPAGKRHNDIEQKAVHVLGILPAEPVTEPIARIYAKIRAHADANGLTLDDNDLWIAATVMNFAGVLVSRDKDFSRVPGLTVEDWTV